MIYEGTTTCFPLEVKWSGDDETQWVYLMVSYLGNDIADVVAYNDEYQRIGSAALSMRAYTFSTQLINLVHAAIEDAADIDGQHWKEQTWSATTR